jgi:hypothetical protein
MCSNDCSQSVCNFSFKIVEKIMTENLDCIIIESLSDLVQALTKFLKSPSEQTSLIALDYLNDFMVYLNGKLRIYPASSIDPLAIIDEEGHSSDSSDEKGGYEDESSDFTERFLGRDRGVSDTKTSIVIRNSSIEEAMQTNRDGLKLQVMNATYDFEKKKLRKRSRVQVEMVEYKQLLESKLLRLAFMNLKITQSRSF